MSKTAKILIGLAGGLGLLLVLVLVGGYLAMNYVEKRLEASVKPDEDAGIAYGRTVDQQGCITEGLKRSRSMTFIDLSKQSSLGAFVEGCLKNSKPVNDFCVGVPGFWDMNDTKWKVAECDKVGMDERKTGCMAVFQAKRSFCSPAP